MESLPALDDLVHLVEFVDPGARPLELLTEAMILSGRLGDLGDELIGHFVERARHSGATWAEIGECMGVTKQAAQKRFTATRSRGGDRRGFFITRLTEQARQVVRRAAAHARRSGSAEIGTEHLVLGLVDEPDSTACRAITGLGATLDGIRAATLASIGSGPRAGSLGHLPFSADSKKVLGLALREAIRSGDRRIGTEHVLLGILRDQRSPGARVLVEQGVTRKSVEQWLRDN